MANKVIHQIHIMYCTFCILSDRIRNIDDVTHDDKEKYGLFPREQGWHSCESARLPSMWPGFDSRTQRHMWVEFVVGFHPCSKRFFSLGTPVFPFS